MVFGFDAATPSRPKGSPSNSLKITGSHEVTFSPAVRLRKSFNCNTYRFPRNCCKQKTYCMANSFGCNTYKKRGGGGWGWGWGCLPLSINRNAPHFFSCTYEFQIQQPICFDIHAN